MPSASRFRYVERPAAETLRPRGTLVLIHAFPLGAAMWEPQMSLAQGGWRVLAPQLRGFGGANEPAASTIDDYAGDVIDLLDALHIQDAVFCGLSMGGYITFSIFRHAPQYFRGLILADTRPQADTPEGIEGRRRMIALAQEKGVPAVADDMLPKLLGESTRRERPAIVERVRLLMLSNSADAVVGAVKAMMSRPDSTPLLSSIHLPTLVIVGDEDTLTPPTLSEGLHRAIPGSELVKIARCGHLSNLEQPEAFNAAVAPFLAHRI